MGILTAIVAVFLAIYTIRLILMPNLPALVRFLVFLLETAYLIYGILCMRKSARKQTFSGARALWIPIFALLIIGTVGATYLETHHHRFTAHFIADEVNGIPDGMENVLEWGSIIYVYPVMKAEDWMYSVPLNDDCRSAWPKLLGNRAVR